MDHRVILPDDGCKWSTYGRVSRQIDDPIMLLRHSHFTLGTQHAVAFDTADLALLELDACAGNGGT